MKPTQPILFVTCMTFAVVCTGGCQSGFMKKPNLGKLAFWNNDNLQLAAKDDDVPPPSRHFSPDPATPSGGSATKQIAKSQGSQNRNNTKADIDKIIANSKKASNDALEIAKSTADSVAAPIRKPYSLKSIDPKINPGADLKNASNDFALKNSAKDFNAAAASAIASAKESATDSVAAAGKNLESPKNVFNGWKNDFQQATQKTIQQVGGELPSSANKALASAASTVGQASKTATSTLAKTASAVKDSVDNSFKPGKTLVVKNPYSDAKPVDSNGISDSINKISQGASQRKAELSSMAEKFVAAGTSSTAKLSQSFTANPLVPKATSTKNDFAISTSTSDSSTSSGSTTSTNLLQPQPTRTADASILPGSSSTGQTSSLYPTTGFESFAPIKRTAAQSSIDSLEGSDVYKIPASLLRGDSSFAPGSTKPLRPSQSQN